ncbi:MAG: hypothetical protein Q9225_005447 [Loekoesia sp. 1 TL-2023]
MKSSVISTIFGTAALIISSVAGSVLPNHAIKRYEQSGPCYELLGEPHCIVTKRDGGPCWENPNGQIRCPLKERGTCWEAADGQVHCNPRDKRGNCWEAPNGQIQCNEDALTGNDGSTTQDDLSSENNSSNDPAPSSTSDSNPASNTEVTAASTTESSQASTTSPSTDPTAAVSTTGDDTPTTDDQTTAETCVRTADGSLQCGNVMIKRSQRHYASCYHSAGDGVVHCQAPSLTTPGNGPRGINKRNAAATPIRDLSMFDIENREAIADEMLNLKATEPEKHEKLEARHHGVPDLKAGETGKHGTTISGSGHDGKGDFDAHKKPVAIRKAGGLEKRKNNCHAVKERSTTLQASQVEKRSKDGVIVYLEYWYTHTYLCQKNWNMGSKHWSEEYLRKCVDLRVSSTKKARTIDAQDDKVGKREATAGRFGFSFLRFVRQPRLSRRVSRVRLKEEHSDNTGKTEQFPKKFVQN